MRDFFLLVLIFVSVLLAVGMQLMPSDKDILWYPFPYEKSVAIHPQSWYHMGFLRFRMMMLILIIGILWNPNSLRYWFMLLIFFLLEVADVIDYFLRYGLDFFDWLPGLDMHTLKIPIYLFFAIYNYRKDRIQYLKYAKE